MEIMDINCLLGHWPFRRLYKNTLADLQQVHRDNHITGGCVSSMNSIFYNDPFEGEEELYGLIRGTGYRHVLTVNPTLPAYREDVENGARMFDMAAVRVYPGYHGYRLDNKHFRELCHILQEHRLPLILSLRLEDERLNYVTQPVAPTMVDVTDFLSAFPELTVVITYITMGELQECKGAVHGHTGAYFDTSGLKHGPFVVERAVESFGAGKVVYGSLYPLYCLKSTLLPVTEADIGEDAKEKILSGNYKKIFRLVR